MVLYIFIALSVVFILLGFELRKRKFGGMLGSLFQGSGSVLMLFCAFLNYESKSASDRDYQMNYYDSLYKEVGNRLRTLRQQTSPVLVVTSDGLQREQWTQLRASLADSLELPHEMVYFAGVGEGVRSQENDISALNLNLYRILKSVPQAKLILIDVPVDFENKGFAEFREYCNKQDLQLAFTRQYPLAANKANLLTQDSAILLLSHWHEKPVDSTVDPGMLTQAWQAQFEIINCR